MRFAVHAWPALLVAAGAVVLSGCGGGSSPSVVRSASLTASPSTGSPPAGSPSPTSGTAPVSSPGSPGGPGAQSVTISPSTGLRSGMTVHVSAAGFTPNQPLVINECADKGAATGPGDCNLSGLVATTADTSGRVSADYVVTSGPFGANNIVCSATQPCLLSVSQAVPSPSEEADVRLRFD